MPLPPLEQADGRFVYGMSVYGLDALTELDAPAESHPAVQVHISMRVGERERLHPLDAHRAVEPIGPAHEWVLDRAAGTACLVGPPLEPDLLAHPCLAPVAVAVNRWAGRESFHAASFLLGGRAFGVIGPRTAGKSTLMAALAGQGETVLADDIVITDGRVTFPGPRCIDLRAPIPGLHLATVSARLGTRWRLPLPSAPASVAMGGWVFLRWGSDVSMRPCSAGQVLSRLAQWRGRRMLASDPTVLLDLAALPAWELTRPHDWSAFTDATGTLTETLAALVPC